MEDHQYLLGELTGRHSRAELYLSWTYNLELSFAIFDQLKLSSKSTQFT
jgi:hypothetical protein